MGVADMKKKILIGSAFAVTILVGVLLTSAVGYQSIESNLKESPLFKMRIRGEIERNKYSITYEYLGKNSQTSIIIPSRNPDFTSNQRVIGYFRKIDDISLKRILNFVLCNIQKNNKINSRSINEIVNIFKLSINKQSKMEDIPQKQEFESKSGYDIKEPLATVIDPVCLTTNSLFLCFITWLLLFIIQLRSKIKSYFICFE